MKQTDPGNLRKPIWEQDHEALAFLGGTFKYSLVNWTKYEEEGYAIVKICEVRLLFPRWLSGARAHRSSESIGFILSVGIGAYFRASRCDQGTKLGYVPVTVPIQYWSCRRARQSMSRHVDAMDAGLSQEWPQHSEGMQPSGDRQTGGSTNRWDQVAENRWVAWVSSEIRYPEKPQARWWWFGKGKGPHFDSFRGYWTETETYDHISFRSCWSSRSGYYWEHPEGELTLDGTVSWCNIIR